MLLHDGTRVYCFSKELLAFLLVAFCPYCIANDPNAGPMDNHYAKALRDCVAVTYEACKSVVVESSC
jgi:hypothetical protein